MLTAFEFIIFLTIMESIESIKSIAELNFKMYLIRNIQDFHHIEVLQILNNFYIFSARRENHHTDCPDFP